MQIILTNDEIETIYEALLSESIKANKILVEKDKKYDLSYIGKWEEEVNTLLDRFSLYTKEKL